MERKLFTILIYPYREWFTILIYPYWCCCWNVWYVYRDCTDESFNNNDLDRDRVGYRLSQSSCWIHIVLKVLKLDIFLGTTLNELSFGEIHRDKDHVYWWCCCGYVYDTLIGTFLNIHLMLINCRIFLLHHGEETTKLWCFKINKVVMFQLVWCYCQYQCRCQYQLLHIFIIPVLVCCTDMYERSSVKWTMLCLRYVYRDFFGVIHSYTFMETVFGVI